MSDIEAAVVEALGSNSALTDLVGTRFFHATLPETATRPAVVYQLVSDVSDHTHDGPSGLARARVQFTCWADTKESAAAVSRALRMTLSGIRGTYAEVDLRGGFKVSEVAGWQPDVKLRRRTLDYAFFHTEEVA